MRCQTCTLNSLNTSKLVLKQGNLYKENVMNNFLIGMYGGFDQKKYKRDFRSDFWGIEACMFPNQSQIDELISKSKQDCFSFGVHFPLRNLNREIRDPLFLSPNKEERMNAITDFKDEVKFVSSLGAQYILVHFPTPFILSHDIDMSIWRLSDKRELLFEEEYSYEVIESYCYELFKTLEDISEQYKIRVLLENNAYNKYFYETDLLKKLFVKHTALRSCLDFGRLHLLEKTDSRFNATKIIYDLAPYTDSIHLWNVKVDLNLSGGHYPVLPDQLPEEGWADIANWMKILLHQNNNVRTLFEHRSDLISDKQLEQCYNWVGSFFEENDFDGQAVN